MLLKENKTLIFGLGNPILSDDSVGVLVVEKLDKMLEGEHLNVQCDNGSIGGLKILDIIKGYKKVVFVDSIEGKTPGKFYELPLDVLSFSFHMTSPHSINLFTALNLGRQIGYDMPEEIKIYVMEVKNNREFGDQLTPEVRRNLENFAKFIKERETGG